VLRSSLDFRVLGNRGGLKGRWNSAQGCAGATSLATPWVSHLPSFRPEGPEESVPHILFIEFNLIPPQEAAKLILKSKPPVMFRLRSNVFSDFSHT